MTINKRAVSYIKHKLSSNDILDLLIKKIVVFIAQVKFRSKYHSTRVNPNKFVFECFQGKNVCDSPWALYKELYNEYNGYQFYWVLNSDNHPLMSELLKYKNTKVVIYGTKQYDDVYASSKYWITNCRLPFRLYKKNEQKYVQCWHGTPLKKLGLDIEVGSHSTTSMEGMRFSYHTDSIRYNLFLSPSEYASKRFCSSFNLPEEKIIELGYPRNDELVNDKNNLQKINDIKDKLNIDRDKRVVLYAPTWRDKQFSVSGLNYYFDNPLENNKFTDNFDDSVVFLFRGHYFTSTNQASKRFIDVSEYNNVNDLYLISDVLVTDYSSVFFDYALLNRPIYFYMYDREHYENEARGFYLDIEKELPGEIVSEIDGLVHALKSTQKHIDHKNFNHVFNPLEDGQSSQRVIERLFVEL
ncbi:CDP-glycerol glycerophosphotransferase family protein [Photobacterium profundum]|uniref:CDP-glycerol glycerophosphotransferase family protein n=1 Tax=Photobacterium profundum TaxID=74109 RepID=UPI0002E5AA1F|nr:CDP-glycerol glycerophosphotransferase family protein [Photobacterium profundum]